MVDAAGAVGRETQFAGLAAPECDQFLNGLHRQAGRHDKDERRCRHLNNRHEIAHRIVAQLGVHARVGAVRAACPQQKGVAVRRRARDCSGAEAGARATAILNDDRLPQHFAEPRPNDARDYVDATAGRERHNDLDRLARIGLRPYRQRAPDCRQRGRARDKQHPSDRAKHFHVVILRSLKPTGSETITYRSPATRLLTPIKRAFRSWQAGTRRWAGGCCAGIVRPRPAIGACWDRTVHPRRRPC